MSKYQFYVATLDCGCGVGICVDRPEFKRETAKDIAQWVRDGYNVQRLDGDLAHEAFRHQCVKYPHTDWQKRNARSAVKARTKTLLEELR